MMGEIADYYQSQELDAIVAEELRAFDNEFWKCKDGRRLRPREMTTEHLRNAIAFVERAYAERSKAYEAPMFWSGEEAEDWHRSVPVVPDIEEVWPIIETMREELKRR